MSETEQSEVTLEPCPFCRQPVRAVAVAGLTTTPLLVGCDNQSCPASDISCSPERWNRRASVVAPQGDAAELKKLSSRIGDVIEESLRSYRCQYTRELPDLENGLSLVDLLTPQPDKDVTRGLQEMELLADYIAADVDDVIKAFATPVTAPVSTGEQSETGWLLEKIHNGNVHYISADHVLTWTDDPNKALRLARREDAEALCTIVEDCEKIASHEWVPAAASTTPDGEREQLSKRERDEIGRAIAESEIAGCSLENSDIDALVDLFEAWLERRAATPTEYSEGFDDAARVSRVLNNVAVTEAGEQENTNDQM